MKDRLIGVILVFVAVVGMVSCDEDSTDEAMEVVVDFIEEIQEGNDDRAISEYCGEYDASEGNVDGDFRAINDMQLEELKDLEEVLHMYRWSDHDDVAFAICRMKDESLCSLVMRENDNGEWKIYCFRDGDISKLTELINDTTLDMLGLLFE